YDPGMRGKHICTLIASLCLASAAITAQAAQKQRAFTPENSGFNIMPIAPADDNGALLDPTVLPNNPGNAAAAQKQREFAPENSGFNIMPIAPADDNGAALDPTVLPNNPGNAAVVPEPATWGMLILGSGLLAGVRRFRRKHL